MPLAIRRKSQGQILPLSRPIPLHGFRAIDLQREPQRDRNLSSVTKREALPHGDQTVADLYRHRWQVELFFKWVKQHLRIKSFFGTTENAVKSQTWIAISVYMFVAIIKKRLRLETELYTMLQILSLTLFEKIPLDQLLMKPDCKIDGDEMDNQLNLFDLTLGR